MIHQEAQRIIDSIIANPAYRIRSQRFYWTIIDGSGEIVYKLWPGGFIEWKERWSWEYVRVRDRRRFDDMIRTLERRG